MTSAPRVTKQDLIDFMQREFGQSTCIVESVDDNGATLRRRVGPNDVRPGNSVSGPVLMEVADVALYVAILSRIGLVPLAVTTSLNINFMRKPAADRDVIGVCKLLKVGRTLAIGEVSLYSDGSDAVVAHAVGTYSIPPNTKP